MSEATLAERRRCRRVAVNKQIVVVVDSDRDGITNHVFALDMSELGVRIRSKVNLLPGQLVTVIPRAGNDHQAVPSRVVWVSQRSDGSGEAGLAFLQAEESGARQT
jgi:PilZ domain